MSGEPVFDHDNPEWTDADFARARPLSAFPDLEAALTRKLRGKQNAPVKKMVTIRLDQDIVARLRATGPGWQSRLNDALRGMKF